jgi:hypothetical protein
LPGTISLQSLSIWQANCNKAQAKEENLTKNVREEVKAKEGGITVKSFRKV